jgi:hypothetical protein
MGFIGSELSAELKPGKDFSFDSIADGKSVIGFGDLICSSQASNAHVPCDGICGHWGEDFFLAVDRRGAPSFHFSRPKASGAPLRARASRAPA